MTAFESVVFDMDDTLFLERDYVRSGFDAVGTWLKERAGLEGFALCAWQLFEQGVRGSIFDVALQAIGAQPSAGLIDEAVRHYRSHAPNIALTTDARAALIAAALVSKVAVISDGPLVSQQAKVIALGLDQWVKPIVLTDACPKEYAKPGLAAFRFVESTHRAAGPTCVYIADNPTKDFSAPHHLGWWTIRIRRHGSLHFDEPSRDDVSEEFENLNVFLARLT